MLCIDTSMFHCRDTEMISCFVYEHFKNVKSHHPEEPVEITSCVAHGHVKNLESQHPEEPTYEDLENVKTHHPEEHVEMTYENVAVTRIEETTYSAIP